MQSLLAELWALVLNFIASLLALFRSKNSIYFDSTKMSVVVDSSSGSIDGADALGEGAFSTVYRAASRTDPSQLYAVKRMILQSPEFERALYQEIDSFQRFRHANIIRLIDSQVVSEGASAGTKVAYLLFPLMRRGTLRDELNRTILAPTAASSLGSRAPHRHARALQQVLSDFLGIVSALHVLHSHSPAYVHQDLKPENVLIGDDGTPLLTDFGSVRLAEISITNRAQALAVADEAASFCTISYRAPELFDPPKGSRLDTRTDVWAVGCLLFAWYAPRSPLLPLLCLHTPSHALFRHPLFFLLPPPYPPPPAPRPCPSPPALPPCSLISLPPPCPPGGMASRPSSATSPSQARPARRPARTCACSPRCRACRRAGPRRRTRASRRWPSGFSSEISPCACLRRMSWPG